MNSRTIESNLFRYRPLDTEWSVYWNMLLKVVPSIYSEKTFKFFFLLWIIMLVIKHENQFYHTYATHIHYTMVVTKISSFTPSGECSYNRSDHLQLWTCARKNQHQTIDLSLKNSCLVNVQTAHLLIQLSLIKLIPILVFFYIWRK